MIKFIHKKHIKEYKEIKRNLKPFLWQEKNRLQKCHILFTCFSSFSFHFFFFFLLSFFLFLSRILYAWLTFSYRPSPFRFLRSKGLSKQSQCKGFSWKHATLRPLTPLLFSSLLPHLELRLTFAFRPSFKYLRLWLWFNFHLLWARGWKYNYNLSCIYTHIYTKTRGPYLRRREFWRLC